MGERPTGSTRPGWWQDALIAVSLLALVADVVALGTRWGGLEVVSAIDGIAYLLLAIFAAVLTAARALRPGPGDRLAWTAMAMGSTLFAIGVVIVMYEVLALGRAYSFPSLADVAYVPAELLWTVAVLLLAGRTLATERLRLLLDGSVVAASVAYLTWIWVMLPLYLSRYGDVAAAAVALAYPILDVTQIVIVVSIISYSRRVDRSLLCIGLAMVLVAISTIAFASEGSTHPSNFDAFDVAAFVAIMVAARARRRAHAKPEDAQPATWQTLLPYAPLVVVAPVALDNLFRAGGVDPVSRILLSGLVAGVILRQMAVVLEARTLAASLARTSAEQRLLIQQAPVGISRLDAESRILTVNRYLEDMLATPAAALIGRRIGEVLQVGGPGAAVGELAGRDPEASGPQLRNRIIRPDGSALWCSSTVTTIRGPNGRAETSVAIVEDVTDRMRQVERAAEIQRALLPDTAPDIPGYDLAGACRAAEDVAGDFYDWVVTPDGRLDLTVADVMGKGMAAAMVMAILHTALRSAETSRGPADRARLAAAAMGRGVSRGGLFVTMVEASLDPPSGLLRYVDAGHGLWAIRRLGGELVTLPGRSLPIGVRDDEAFAEGTTRLDPGDTLIIYSDGLVERPDRTIELREFERELAEPASAADTVRRLMARMPARPADDVTIVVLRRLAAGQAGSPPAGTAASRSSTGTAASSAESDTMK